MSRRCLLLVLLLMPLGAMELPLLEDLALGDPAAREAALERLLPGSDEHFYHRCLLAQHRGDLAQVDSLLDQWLDRHGSSSRWETMRRRQAILWFGQDPARGSQELIEQLEPELAHQRPRLDHAPAAARHLDPDAVGWPRFRDPAVAGHDLDRFTPSGLRRLIEDGGLDASRRRQLLRALDGAEHPQLLPLVIADLRQADSGGFGSLELHARLDLGQLDALAAAHAEVLSDPDYVDAWLRAQYPQDPARLAEDPAALAQHCQRLWRLVGELGPAFASLQAQVLHHRLRADLARDQLEPELVLRYLRLPWPEHQAQARHVVDPRQDFGDRCGLDPIRAHPALVDELLERLLVAGSEPAVFHGLVDRHRLELALVRARLHAPAADPVSVLARIQDPALVRELRQPQLRLAPGNPSHYRGDQAVALQIEHRNLRTLGIEIRAIDLPAWYRSHARALDVDDDFSGIRPSHRRELELATTPLRRHRQQVPLPECVGAGCWVVDLIAEGLQARALIRKGRLLVLEERDASGHRFLVHDEDGRPLPAAVLELGGQRFAADATGAIHVPATSQPMERSAIIIAGELAQRQAFAHRATVHRLLAELALPRQQLVPGTRASLLLHAQLRLEGGVPVAVQQLRDPVLDLILTRADGEMATRSIDDLVLAASGTRLDFEVPPELRQLQWRLHGRVLDAGGETAELEASGSIAVNGISDGQQIADLHLEAAPDGWRLLVLGRSGEAIPGAAVRATLSHRDGGRPQTLPLRSDAEGRIELGGLPELVRLDARVGQLQRHWRLDEAPRLPARLHAATGSELRLAVPAGTPLDRRTWALQELRREAVHAERFEHLEREPGYLVLRGLPAGDHLLRHLPSGAECRIAVAAGPALPGRVVASDRALGLAATLPLQVSGLTAVDGELRIQLSGAGARTRVHLFASRLRPAHDPLDALLPPAIPVAETRQQRLLSDYRDGLTLDTEQRYVLDRRDQPRRFGVMLERPGLNLNPWPLRETLPVEDPRQLGAFGQRSGGGRKQAVGRHGGSARLIQGQDDATDYAFLAQPTVVLSDLVPDAAGRLRLPLEQLQGRHDLRILASDGRSAIGARLVLPPAPLATHDLRLESPFPATQHLAVQRIARGLAAGEDLRLQGLPGSRVAVYRELGEVFQLLRGLAADSRLDDFAVLGRWHRLTPAEQHAAYDRLACHELHLFLAKRDRPFFDTVVRPYLANLLHPTVIDDILLERELEGWLEPWRLARLNAVERILLARALPQEAAALLAPLRREDPAEQRTAGQLLDQALGQRALDGQGDTAFMAIGAGGGASGAFGVRMARRSGGREEASAMSEVELEQPVEEILAEVEGFAEPALAPPIRKPKAWAENRYDHIPWTEQDADLVPRDALWHDLAGPGPALSPHLAAAGASRTRALLALALLDLPLQAAAAENDGLIRGPAIVIAETLAETAAVAEATVLVIQRSEDLEGRPLAGPVTTGTPCVSSLRVVNLAEHAQRLAILVQIPPGAIRLQGAATAIEHVQLAPGASWSTQRSFYFPSSGSYVQHPAGVSAEGALVGRARPSTWTVVDHLPADAWLRLCAEGSRDELLAALAVTDLEQHPLHPLAWRLQQAESYHAIRSVLRQRRVPAPLVAAYGLLHRDPSGIRDYLHARPDFLDHCGPALVSDWFQIDPVARHRYEHWDIAPLVAVRAHPVDGRFFIADQVLEERWRSLLEICAHSPQPTPEERLQAAALLANQDRFAAAERELARSGPDTLDQRLQADYLRAWLALSRGDTASAGALARSHAGHPVPRWRLRFEAIDASIAQAQRAAKLTDGETAAVQATISLRSEGQRLLVTARGVAQCELRFHPLDVELRFSRSPFATDQPADGPVLRPALVRELTLEAGRGELVLPAELHGESVLVEARAGASSAIAMITDHACELQIAESRGELQVLRQADAQPLPGAYVKVYARLQDGRVQFHKDGYTDLRGRFDFAALSTPSPTVERFAILLMHPEAGSVIREAAPPVR